MKKRNFLFGTVLCAALVSSVIFAACGDSKTVNVTFDYNYDGAPAAYVTEPDEDGLVTPPSDPQRRNYEFTRWNSDAACTEKADFEYAITTDTTFYAGWNKVASTVTFNPNYDGAVTFEQDVKIGDTISQPANPERTGNWLFEGWYKNLSDTSPFSFETAITDELTLFAKWTEFSGSVISVTYNYNYEGAGEYYKSVMQADRRPEKPGDPKREGYFFDGWFEDAACTKSFSFSNRLSENKQLYARWLKTYTFEAEYTDLNGKNGAGYSGETGGTDLICNDRNGKPGQATGQAGASNGFYLASLYQENLSIDFVINSSVAVEDAVIELRLSVEYFDKTFTPDLFKVEVNGQSVAYPTIELKEAVAESDVSQKGIRPFTNHVINASVKLVEGRNVIKLVVTNDIDRGGTMAADAPAIDCMYIHTDAELTWTPKTENLNGKL